MYGIDWDDETGGFALVAKSGPGLRNEVRPVFYQELELLGFNSFWDYPCTEDPLLWAIGGRKYYYRGELVAEAEGGGLFSRPELKIHRPGLTLEPVRLDAMVAKNGPLLQGLVQRSLKFIHQTYTRYRDRVDVLAVAFSGGKDSLVTLDLVQRVLEPDQFKVVFGDTGMEVSDTYLAVEAAKSRWPHLTFHTARSVKDPRTSWREMGPPSRIHRWCCSVHKTAPTLLLLRQLAGKPSATALIFDGIRHEESLDRASYADVTEGGKHKTQVNASPIIAWNAGEVFLYLFGRRLLLNQAYRYGVVRVGCSVCPMASSWSNTVIWRVYQQDTSPLVDELRDYALAAGIRREEVDAYLDAGSWKGRAGGRHLPSGGTRVVEQVKDQRIVFTLRQPSEDWQEWARALGRLSRTGEGEGCIEHGGIVYPYVLRREGANVTVEVEGLANADRFVLKAFRAVALKSAYCCHCQACQVECPTGALLTHGKVTVGDNCLACGACLDLHGEACLTAKSLETSEGGAVVKGKEKKVLHMYEGFGMRAEWLSAFLQAPEEWVSGNRLGNRQFDAMLLWLKHAELVTSGSTKRTLAVTDLGKRLAGRGVGDRLTWAVIWANLARNSTPVHWYLASVPWGATLTKREWIARLGDTHPHSERTRHNAMQALSGLLTDTPLGDELGLGVRADPAKAKGGALYKRGWAEPDPIAVLYSLYRYAERSKRHELTVRELYEGAAEGPYTVYGVHRETLEAILKGLSARGNSLIRVDIVRDLDNVFLDHQHGAAEVLDFA